MRPCRWSAVFAALAAVAHSSGPCGAGEEPQPVGEIRGRVFDPDRGPAPGAVVEAFEPEPRDVYPGEDDWVDPYAEAVERALGPPPGPARVAARASAAMDGSFRLTGLRANVEYRVAVTLRATMGRPDSSYPGVPSSIAEGVRPGTRDLVLQLRQPPR